MGDLLIRLPQQLRVPLHMRDGLAVYRPTTFHLGLLLILRSTLNVVKDAYHFLMEGVPNHLDYVLRGQISQK